MVLNFNVFDPPEGLNIYAVCHWIGHYKDFSSSFGVRGAIKDSEERVK